jgi:hypothetical protein
MLQRLYDLFFEIKEYVLLAGLIIVSLLLMLLNDNVQMQQIRSIVTVTFGIAETSLALSLQHFACGLKTPSYAAPILNLPMKHNVFMKHP